MREPGQMCIQSSWGSNLQQYAFEFVLRANLSRTRVTDFRLRVCLGSFVDSLDMRLRSLLRRLVEDL
jgi:hypothetical protein